MLKLITCNEIGIIYYDEKLILKSEVIIKKLSYSEKNVIYECYLHKLKRVSKTSYKAFLRNRKIKV